MPHSDALDVCKSFLSRFPFFFCGCFVLNDQFHERTLWSRINKALQCPTLALYFILAVVVEVVSWSERSVDWVCGAVSSDCSSPWSGAEQMRGKDRLDYSR